jgi:serine/threonine protein kinase
LTRGAESVLLRRFFARLQARAAGAGILEASIPFGHYELLSRINVGVMAEILKARDLERPGGPLLAVKRILPHLTEDPQYVTMFLDESRVLAQLSHANIIRTFDVGQVGPTPYLALEYVHGHDARMLFHRCRRDGQPVPLRIACYVMAEVCAGLHFAHEQLDADGNLLGIVHRDVSLQNVLVSYDGDVKLIDFGIAMSAANMARTEVGIVKGKFGYMSPEQVKGEPLDRRSDVFAAGICLYELLTGERLFSGDNDYAAVERVRNVRIDPPSRLNRQIPSALESLVMKALAKSPRDRFQSAADMRRALQAFMSESGNVCTPDDLARQMRVTFADELNDVPGGSSGETVATSLKVEPRPLKPRDALTGLAAFDDLEPVSALTSLDHDLVPPEPRPQYVSEGGGRPVPIGAPAPAPAAMPAPSPAQLNQSAPLSAPPTSDLHLLGQPSAPVDMDWDEDEPITQHESVHALPRVPELEESELESLPPEIDDDDRTRQVYVGATFSGVVPRGSGIQPGPAEGVMDVAPAAAAPVASSSGSEVTGPVSYSSPPPSFDSVSTARPMAPRASYSVVVAVVVTIVAVIAVGLMATRGTQSASVHLSTLPVEAEVRVDDVPIRLERSPYVIGDLEPEVMHQLDVRSAGYESWSTRITLQPGQVLKLPRVALVPIAKAEERPVAQPAPQIEPPPEPALERPKRSPKAIAPKIAPPKTAPPKAAPKKVVQTEPAAPREVKEKEPAPAAGGTGILRINSRPWSQVVVDGRTIGNTPQMSITLEAGSHTVTLINSEFGYKKTIKVAIKAGEVVTKIVDLP